MMKLHERLRRLRTGKHMTQAEVAERLHVTRQTVSSYESGRTEPDVEKLKCLAKIYGVTLEELLRFEAPDKRNTGRRALRVLRGTEALILICTLVRSVLLWVANRFYAVQDGPVSQEMMAVLETRFAVTGAARWFESALLAGGWWLGTVLLVQSVQRSVPAKRQWADVGLLAGGMLMVTVPWNLADPLYGFSNYGYVVVPVLCRAALFLAVGLLAGLLFRKRA